MEDSRLPKTIFFSELANRYRNTGSLVKKYKDNIKSSLIAYHIPISTGINLAKDYST